MPDTTPTAAHMEPPVEPSTIGRHDGYPHLPQLATGYELETEIARGGMGIVYRARDVAMNREVAVKILQAKFPLDGPASRRFVEEAQITGQLQHPGIPPIHHIGKMPDGRPFLAMKLVKGETLDSLLKSKTPVNTLAVFEAIAQAVGYAHAHGVIHRDLKPANVMVGSFGEVQVMDWGLAKVLTSPQRKQGPDTDPDATLGSEIRSLRDSYDETHAGSVLGTPAFMPPEQAIGANDEVDAQSDVFGLGAILCVMLTGRPPYVGGDAESTRKLAARGKLEDAFNSLGSCVAEPELVALCKCCLSAEKAARPANGYAVATEVARLRAAAEERAKQAEIAKAADAVRAEEQRTRQRLRTRLATAIAASLAIGAGLSLWQAKRAMDAEKATGEQLTKTQQAENEITAQLVKTQAEEKRALAAEAKANAEKKKAIEFRDQALVALRATTGLDVEKLIGARRELTANEKTYLEAIAKRWQAFAQREGADESSRAIQAEGHFRVANLWEKLGRPEEAKQEYERAVAIREKLAAEFPTAPDVRNDLATSHKQLAFLLTNLGQHQPAEQHFRKSLAIREKLNAEFPAVLEYRQNLAWTNNNYALLLAVLGKPDDAKEQHRKALALREKLAAEFPALADCRQELAGSHNNLAILLVGMSQPADADGHYHKAQAIQEKLAAEFPDMPDYRLELAGSHNNRGHLLRDMKKHPEAEVQFRKALGLHEKLAAEFPAIPVYRQNLANSHNSLGLALVDLGKQPEAEEQHRKALAIRERLAAEFPSVPDYRQELAKSHNNLATVLANLRKRPEAEEQYRKALAIREQLATEFPAVPEYRVDLAGHYSNFGLMVRNGGKAADSLEWFAKAIRILTPIHEQEPRDATAKKFLRNSHSNRAVAYDQLHQFAEAIKDWERAIELSVKEEQTQYRTGRTASQNAEKTIADIEFAFQQPAAQIPKLLGIRVKVMLKRKQIPDAVATAERFAVWAEKQETDRDGQRYNAAGAFALCAAASDTDREKLLDRTLALLRLAKSNGYFTAAKIAHVKQYADFNGIRKHPKFVAFVKELEPPREPAPPPRVAK